MVLTVTYRKRRLDTIHTTSKLRQRSASWCEVNYRPANATGNKKRRIPLRPKSESFSVPCFDTNVSSELNVMPPWLMRARSSRESSALTDDRYVSDSHDSSVFDGSTSLYSSIFESFDLCDIPMEQELIDLVCDVARRKSYKLNDNASTNVFDLFANRDVLRFLLTYLASHSSTLRVDYANSPCMQILDRVISNTGMLKINNIIDEIRSIVYQYISFENSVGEEAYLGALIQMLHVFGMVVSRAQNSEQCPKQNTALVNMFFVFLTKLRQLRPFCNREVSCLLLKSLGCLIKLDGGSFVSSIILPRMVRSWPVDGSSLCVVYLELIDSVLHLCPSSLLTGSPSLYGLASRMSNILSCENARCVQRTLGILGSPHFMMNYIACDAGMHHVISAALFANSRAHWNFGIREECEELFDGYLDFA